MCCSQAAVLTACSVGVAGNLWGFQLWICLPKKDKMIKPRYQDIQVLQHGLALCSSITPCLSCPPLMHCAVGLMMKLLACCSSMSWPGALD